MKYKKEVFQSFSMVMQFGITMLVPIFMCTALGIWLGEKTNITWLAIPFFFLGAVAGFRNIFILARKIYDSGKDRKRDDYK